MKLNPEVLNKSINLLLNGKSYFDVEEYLKDNDVTKDEIPDVMAEVIELAGAKQSRLFRRKRKIRMIISTVVLLALIVLFTFGFLEVVHIGLIGILIIFWTLQLTGILGAKKKSESKFRKY